MLPYVFTDSFWPEPNPFRLDDTVYSEFQIIESTESKLFLWKRVRSNYLHKYISIHIEVFVLVRPMQIFNLFYVTPPFKNPKILKGRKKKTWRPMTPFSIDELFSSNIFSIVEKYFFNSVYNFKFFNSFFSFVTYYFLSPPLVLNERSRT